MRIENRAEIVDLHKVCGSAVVSQRSFFPDEIEEEISLGEEGIEEDTEKETVEESDEE
jgi:hypothetical protein